MWVPLQPLTTTATATVWYKHTHKIYCVLHVAGYKDPSLTLDDFWLTGTSGSALVQLFCEVETLYSALSMSMFPMRYLQRS